MVLLSHLLTTKLLYLYKFYPLKQLLLSSSPPIIDYQIFDIHYIKYLIYLLTDIYIVDNQLAECQNKAIKKQPSQRKTGRTTNNG
ncbi:hypothetical protein H1P_4350005 [Hyella patelloides LEGE 07179]|uniref:Uncharacterized protein n=1 Tax=Hyella patelloides LEGE 07179 TaxID=945734 RepID=A0A563VY32_9CYAN|nr:hypothetical protein H1P_4350005 [Hyella patelloides LEGE 07179]